MATYKIEAIITGDNINRVKEKAKAVFGDGLRLVEKEQKQQSRADRLGDAEAAWDQAKSIVEELHGEMEEWHDNMPDGLKESDQGSKVEEARDALQELLDSLEQCDFSGVEFPGMYGH